MSTASNPSSPSRTLTLKKELHFVRADGRDGLKTKRVGEKVKVTWHGAYMGSGSAYMREMGTDWTATIPGREGKETFKGWPEGWKGREENPRKGNKKGIVGRAVRGGWGLVKGMDEGLGEMVNPSISILKDSPYLGTDGSKVYLLNRHEGAIYGIPLKQQGAWGDVAVPYTDQLEWSRAHSHKVHGTTVITVPWAGGRKEFVVYNNDTFKLLQEAPLKKATKAKSTKAEKYKGFFIKKISTQFGAKYIAAEEEKNLVEGEETFALRTKDQLLRQIDSWAEEHPNSRSNPESQAASMFESFHGKPSEQIQEFIEEEHYHGNLAELGVLVEMKVVTESGYEVELEFEDDEEYGKSENPSKLCKTEEEAEEIVRKLRIRGVAATYRYKETKHGDRWEVISGERAQQFYEAHRKRNPQHEITLLCSNEDGTQLYFVGGDQSVDLKAIKMDGKEWLKDSMVIGILCEITYRTEKKFDKFKLIDYYHKLGEETGVEPMLIYDRLNERLSVSGGQYHIKRPLIGVSAGIEN